MEEKQIETSHSFKEWIAARDQAIRAGATAETRALLLRRIGDRFNEPLAREQTLDLARLCRRTGLYLQSILLLHRYVRPSSRNPLPPTLPELTEYAGALAQIGAETEALEILRTLPSDSPPETLLFAAFAHFTRWEYSQAIPYLRKFISHPAATVYQRLIGQVNLAASLVIERQSKEATELLKKILLEAPPENRLLRGNLLEISAQNEIQQRNLPQAGSNLEEAARIFASGDLTDQFYLKKWQTILDSFSLKGNLRKNQFSELRALSKKLGHWETLRECDLYEGLEKSKRSHLERCYYGTPFRNYRERIRSESAFNFDRASYDWSPHQKGKPLLDLSESSERKLGQIVDRLLKILASDFYRPLHWVSLHAQLFPGQFLNPRSSATVIHQAVKRTRQWLVKHAPEVELLEISSSYFLTSQRPGSIRVLSNSKPSAEVRIDQLSKLGSKDHSARQCAEAWGIEKHTANRLINEMIAQGRLSRIGSGPGTRYRVITTIVE